MEVGDAVPVLTKLDLDWETTEPCPIRLVDEHAFEDDKVTPQELSSQQPSNGPQWYAKEGGCENRRPPTK